MNNQNLKPASHLTPDASPRDRPRIWRTIALAWRLLGRDYHAGEITLIATAIVIAVAAVTTVGFFTNRVQRVLELEAKIGRASCRERVYVLV